MTFFFFLFESRFREFKCGTLQAQFLLAAPLEGKLLLLASAGTVAFCVTAGVPTSSLDSVATAEDGATAVAAVELAIWMGAPLFWLLLEVLIEARSGASEADGAKSGAALGSLAVTSDAHMLGRRRCQLGRKRRECIKKKEGSEELYIYFWRRKAPYFSIWG